MKRHVFPRTVLAAAGLLLALGVVRAQDGGGEGDPPKPADTGRDPPTAEDGTEGADASAGAEKPAPPKPVAVGEALPERLPLRPLPREGAAPEAEAGAAAADAGVEVATLAGETARPVVLVFWSSRCAVCKRYAAVLRKLVTGLGEQARVVLVASGAEETPEAVREAQKAAELRLPTFLDPDRRAAAALGVRVTPTALVVDAAGVLRYRGPIDDDRRARSRDARELLRPAVDAVLAGKPVENGDVRAFGSSLR